MLWWKTECFPPTKDLFYFKFHFDPPERAFSSSVIRSGASFAAACSTLQAFRLGARGLQRLAGSCPLGESTEPLATPFELEEPSWWLSSSLRLPRIPNRSSPALIAPIRAVEDRLGTPVSGVWGGSAPDPPLEGRDGSHPLIPSDGGGGNLPARSRSWSRRPHPLRGAGAALQKPLCRSAEKLRFFRRGGICSLDTTRRYRKRKGREIQVYLFFEFLFLTFLRAMIPLTSFETLFAGIIFLPAFCSSRSRASASMYLIASLSGLSFSL